MPRHMVCVYRMSSEALSARLRKLKSVNLVLVKGILMKFHYKSPAVCLNAPIITLLAIVGQAMQGEVVAVGARGQQTDRRARWDCRVSCRCRWGIFSLVVPKEGKQAAS